MFKWIWNEKLQCYCAEVNSTIRADRNGNVFGGGGTDISVPQAPTAGESMADWVQNYPAMWELQQKYAPLEAQQQVALAQQYAQPLGQAMKTAQEAMYPQETAFTQQALQQAQTGMNQGLPDWAKQQYMDTMRAQLGENALAGVGADYMSTGLNEQTKNWQDYYRNVGLSIAGKQPIAQATMPGYSNYASQYTPTSVMNYNAQNYGNYANAWSNAQQNQGGGWGSILGAIGGGLAGGIGSGWASIF